MVSRLLALARTRHIEFLDPVLLNEAEQSRGRGFQAPMGPSQMQPGFAVFFANSMVLREPPVASAPRVKMTVPSESRTFYSVRCR